MGEVGGKKIQKAKDPKIQTMCFWVLGFGFWYLFPTFSFLLSYFFFLVHNFIVL